MKKKLFILFILLFLGESMIAKPEINMATFAGGCFWCMEAPFEKQDGIIDVVSGYMGGVGDNPTYKDYAQKGHIEVIQITYDPKKISYDALLNIFWRQIDPTDAEGQFVDRGPQYRSAIFYHTDEQKKLAVQSKEKLEKSKQFTKPIVTEIIKASHFYPAEDYHQDYYKNHSIKYKFYRARSGRDKFLEEYWKKVSPHSKYKKPSKGELKKRLTPLQYKVTQNNGTEPAYNNTYWDLKDAGIYVDIASGEPLFSSLDKYDSKTGWPSFIKPLEPDNIIQKEDRGWFSTRTEVRSRHGDSHLGHVFKDGPPPTGLRYCLNSAALKFIPTQDLQKEGYSEYVKLFI